VVEKDDKNSCAEDRLHGQVKKEGKLAAHIPESAESLYASCAEDRVIENYGTRDEPKYVRTRGKQVARIPESAASLDVSGAEDRVIENYKTRNELKYARTEGKQVAYVPEFAKSLDASCPEDHVIENYETHDVPKKYSDLGNYRIVDGQGEKNDGAEGLCRRLVAFCDKLSTASLREGFYREDDYQRWNYELEELVRAAIPYRGNEAVKYALLEAEDCIDAIMEGCSDSEMTDSDDDDSCDSWDSEGPAEHRDAKPTTTVDAASKGTALCVNAGKQGARRLGLEELD
jgi:hypothetical protein